MAEYIGSAVSGATAVTKEYPVANGVTVSDGDFVYLSSGRVTNASIAGATLLGSVAGGQSQDVSNHSQTLTATGDASGSVRVLVIVEPNAKFVSGVTGGTLSAASVGQAYNLTGATGAQLVDLAAAAATNQVECIQFGYKGNTALGVFIVNKHKYKVNG